MTFPAGGAMIQRRRIGNDYIVNATFSGLTAGSTPSFWYREDPSGTPVTGGGSAYKLQAGYSGGAWQFTLYLDLRDAGGASSALQSGSCAASSSGSVQMFLRVIGAHHQAFCNGSNTPAIDVWDYWNAGGQGAQGTYYALGIQGTGGTATENTYIGNPLTAITFPASEKSLLGVLNPSDAGDGTYLTDPYSLGGNGINHPSIVGHDAFYTAAALPVVLALRHAMEQRERLFLANTGGGGFRDSQANQVDWIGGSSGSRIVDNGLLNILEQWDNSTLTPHIFFRPIQFAPAAAKQTCTALIEGEGYYTKGSGSANGSWQICQNQSGTYTWVTH